MAIPHYEKVLRMASESRTTPPKATSSSVGRTDLNPASTGASLDVPMRTGDDDEGRSSEPHASQNEREKGLLTDEGKEGFGRLAAYNLYLIHVTVGSHDLATAVALEWLSP